SARDCASSEAQWRSRELSAGATTVTSAGPSTAAQIASRSSSLSAVSFAITRTCLQYVFASMVGLLSSRFLQETSRVSESRWGRLRSCSDGRNGLLPGDRERAAAARERARNGAGAGGRGTV